MDIDEAPLAQKDAFVVTGGKGDNDQKVIGVFKDEKSAKKARDDYNRKNRPSKKSHMARIFKQTRLSQAGKRFKPGEKIVIVDDLVATGGTAIACAELLTENFNVRNEDILILCIIDLTDLGGSELIREKGYFVKTIVDY